MTDIKPLLWFGVIVLVIGSILFGRYALRRAFAANSVSGGRIDIEYGDSDRAGSDLFEPPSLGSGRLF